ncbi:MAG TPA: hypothetical protein VFW44_01630 [Bryobacteraceae bacterium]|nr:hypothetical protein [Bryobacteraceae bacterium]
MAAMPPYETLSRRGFIGAACAVAATVEGAAQTGAVRFQVDPQKRLARIPDDFIGLGYEVSSVSERGLLTVENRQYVQLVRRLSPAGVIRIGGNTSDYATWSSNGPAVSSPKATVVDRRGVSDLATFLRATGWRLIWGFNLGSGTVDQAVEEAMAVADSVGSLLLAFEIGNEPDLFPGVHRPANYSYADYFVEYQRFQKAIRDKLPNAPFAGPDVIVHIDWLEQFAKAEAADIKQLTYHYYAEGPPDNPASTIDTLMKPSTILPGILARLQAASFSSGVPYRICEANSCFGGGKPGVSDTMAAALWGLDFMFALAQFGAAGVNMETGVNHLGFLSFYTPIGEDAAHNFIAMPLYYGMLAFSQASRGRLLASMLDPGGVNVSAYAVDSDRGEIWLTVINKEAAREAPVRVACPGVATAKVMRLAASSLASKEGVRFAESRDLLRITGGEFEIVVPAASAVLVRLR